MAPDYCMMVVITLAAAGLGYATYMKMCKNLIAFVLIILQQYFPLSITNTAVTFPYTLYIDPFLKIKLSMYEETIIKEKNFCLT